MKIARLAPLLFACACARPRSPAPPPPLSLSYVVDAGATGRELSVTGTLSPGSPEELSVDHRCEPFVRDVEVDGQKVPRRGDSWFAPSCRAGCVVRYTYLLGDAAAALDDVDRASARGPTLFAPPSTWLLRPIAENLTGTFDLSVKTSGDLRFETGLFPRDDRTYQADLADLPTAPYAGFGPLRTRHLHVDGGEIVLSLSGRYALSDREMQRWVEEAASMVADFYGGFPVRRAWIGVVPSDGAGLFGRTLGNGGASIVLDWGAETTLAAKGDDWIVPHELIHLALPSLPLAHRWLEEGLSTYVEPLVRLRAGVIRREDLWRDLARGLPNGRPEAGDQGLDRTSTWGRTYWGGALYCLITDLEIRRRSGGKASLRDALRAIVAAGGNVSQRWSMQKTLETGDRATGTTVLVDTWTAWRDKPVDVDVPRLFDELGVSVRGERVSFREDAPLAALRREIEGI